MDGGIIVLPPDQAVIKIYQLREHFAPNIKVILILKDDITYEVIQAKAPAKKMVICTSVRLFHDSFIWNKGLTNLNFRSGFIKRGGKEMKKKIYLKLIVPQHITVMTPLVLI